MHLDCHCQDASFFPTCVIGASKIPGGHLAKCLPSNHFGFLSGFLNGSDNYPMMFTVQEFSFAVDRVVFDT
jgi:hypothetical protein